MKYLKLFEKFNARAVASTLEFLKKNNIDHLKFLDDIKDLLKNSIAIDKIDDSDFEYLPSKKAAYLTAPGAKNGIHSIKYWFSLEKGYLGQTLTKSKLPNFVEGMVVNYKKKSAVIQNVTDILELDIDGDRINAKPEEVKLLTKSQQEKHKEKAINLYPMPIYKIHKAIKKGSQYRIDNPATLKKCIDHSKEKVARKILLFKKDNKYQITEIEKFNHEWYLLSTEEYGFSWSTEEAASPFSYYKELGSSNRLSMSSDVFNMIFDEDVIFIDETNESEFASRLNTKEGLDIEKLKDNERINMSDTAGFKSITNKVNIMDKSLTLTKIRLLKDGWVNLKIKRSGLENNVWIYKKSFGTAYVVHNTPQLWRTHDLDDYDPTKYGMYSKKVTNDLGTTLDGAFQILTIPHSNVFSMDDIKTNVSDVNQNKKSGSMDFSGISNIPEKSDFALVLNSNVLGNENYNIDQKQMSRLNNQKDTLKFKTDQTVRSENFQKYAAQIVQKANVTHEDFNNMNFSNIINRFLGNKDTFMKIYYSNYSQVNDVFSYLSMAANHMETGYEKGAEDYIEHIKNIINTAYKIRPKEAILSKLLKFYKKEHGVDEKYEFLERLLKIGELINKKIKDSDIKTLQDVEMVKFNLSKLTAMLVSGNTYKLVGLDDLFYSIKSQYYESAANYMRDMKDRTLKINNKKLDSLEEYIENTSFVF